MRHILRAVLLLVNCWASLVFAEDYSCQASVFMPDSYPHKPVVSSSDHTKYVRLWTSSKDVAVDPESSFFYASVYSGGKRLRTVLLKNLNAGTFLKWSPDSKAFYILWSNGGAIGGYQARAFYWKGDELIESPAPQAAGGDFARHHYCKTRGNNLYVIKWVEGSKELLLQPQVYPTSDCGQQSGFTLGYLVEVDTGEIKDRYRASEMKKLSNGCPSKVFPTAFTTQEEVDKLLEAH